MLPVLASMIACTTIKKTSAAIRTLCSTPAGPQSSAGMSAVVIPVDCLKECLERELLAELGKSVH